MSERLPMDADARVTSDRGGAAEALLWWGRVPALPGERLGAVGGFSATSPEAAAGVLAQAGAALREHGCTLAVGPMDGNTWRRYRLVTDAGAEPPFFLEPTNPPEWPGWWRAAGFGPLAEYCSAVTDDLEPHDPRLGEVADRVRAEDIRLRPIDPERFEEELGRLFDISLASFQDNYLYTPLPHPEFLAYYARLAPVIRPELVLFAERAGQPVGFMFAVADQAQAQRGEPVTTVIMKTIAVRPEFRSLGLGGLMLAEVHAAARRLGFRRAIHALMHETNRSRRMSQHYARVFRRYTLFARRLDR